MHWILLLICCASVYGGMVAKSPVMMLVLFVVAIASCIGWLWVRYRTLFPDGAAATAGAAGLSDYEMESLREHVRAHAKAHVPAAPASFERQVDPEAIRAAAQKVAERDAEARRQRQEAEVAAIAQRALEERHTLEVARDRLMQRETSGDPAPAVPATHNEVEAPAEVAEQATPVVTKPQGPEREIGEVWNPYAGVVQAPKKDVLVHPTSSDAHRDA